MVSKGRKQDSLGSQMGPFAMISVWLLKRCKEPRALQLYAVLMKHAATGSRRRCWPSRRTLAEAMCVSRKTINRAIDVLRRIGALKTSLKHRESDGAVLGTYFELIQIEPPPAEPSQKDIDVHKENQHPKGHRRPAKRTPAAFSSKEELDPPNQIQERTSSGAQRTRAAAHPVKIEIHENQATYKLLEKLVHVTIDEDAFDGLADFTEAVKIRAGGLKVVSDPAQLARAIESVLHVRGYSGREVRSDRGGAQASAWVSMNNNLTASCGAVK